EGEGGGAGQEGLRGGGGGGGGGGPEREREETHRGGERHVRRGREPRAQAVRAGEKAHEGAGGGSGGHEAHGRPPRPAPLTREAGTTQRNGDDMLAIRLRRTGTTKRPYYRVVVADSRAWRARRFVH